MTLLGLGAVLDRPPDYISAWLSLGSFDAAGLADSRLGLLPFSLAVTKGITVVFFSSAY